MNRTTVFLPGNHIDLELTRIFVHVVERGGFSRAAELLGLPKSTVSKAIARLERELASVLLVRTTRAVSATAAGHAYYAQCAPPIAALDAAQRMIGGADRQVAGHLRITAPEDLGARVVSPAIAELAIAHPRLSFEVRYTDQVVDLVRDGFDLAIRVGVLRASRLYARKLGESTLIAVAAPGYLERAPRLRRPEDLTAHPCLAISGDRPPWTLRGPRRHVRVAVEPRIVCNQTTSLVAMAQRGAGVALVPSFLCGGELASGALVRVLPDWRRAGVAISLASPLPSSASVRHKLVIDHFAAAIPLALAA